MRGDAPAAGEDTTAHDDGASRAGGARTGQSSGGRAPSPPSEPATQRDRADGATGTDGAVAKASAERIRPEPTPPVASGRNGRERAAAKSADAAPTEVRPDREAILEAQREMKLEAKNHPAVKLVIQALDAEIRDIRLPRTP